MSRKQRLDMIVRILNEKATGSQLELREMLAESGIEVSQPSLSRDLNFLGAYRKPTSDGSFVYRVPGDEQRKEASPGMKRRFQISVTGVVSSANIVVIYTNPAEAQAIARVVDRAGLDGLLGTVGGDNTVFCVASDEKAAKQICEHMSDLLE
jgi:transcriptional regulator of arginine metabolism